MYKHLFIATSTIFLSQVLIASNIYQATYPFSLPALPYAYKALEPYIDKETMEIHHSKHHQAYVDNLNKALENQPALHKKSLFELLKELESLPENVRTAIRNQGGGHFNHSLFWTMMMPDAPKRPSGSLAAEIDKTFGSFAQFQEEFNTKAKTVFGSGWSWLVTDPKGTLSVITTLNQDAPISKNLTPIIGLDVWEHAYYLKYQNRRPDYITAWWDVINWPQAEQTYALALQTAKK
jgi:Fe-Mn family superoxide dismutase